jgi:hypothetical protein
LYYFHNASTWNSATRLALKASPRLQVLEFSLSYCIPSKAGGRVEQGLLHILLVGDAWTSFARICSQLATELTVDKGQHSKPHDTAPVWAKDALDSATEAEAGVLYFGWLLIT